jgi:hypothetical protein
MVFASDLRSESWYSVPTETQYGQPSGALESKLISVPGRHPISMSFKANLASVKDNILPFSPTCRSDTVRNLVCLD